MTRVLLVSPSAKPGGAERVFCGLARGLAAHGHEPLVALLEEGPVVDWLADAPFEVVRLRAGRLRQPARTAATVLRLARLARSFRAEAIVSSMSKGHLYGGAAALRAGIPAVWWQHDVPRGIAIERLAARIPAAAVVCVSGPAAEAQRRLTPGTSVETIHPGLPLEAVATRRGAGRQIRDALGWDGRPVVGVVGRLQPWKGQETFLRAAATLARDRPELHFAVVGGAILGWEGSYPRDLEHLAADLGLNGSVLFTGHRDDPWDWLDALDVVVHAASGEPFGLVLVEAMALGKPLVATAGPGPSEIVEDGVSGLLVPAGDHGRLAEAVARVLDDGALRLRLAAAGPARAREFSEERMAGRFGDLLERLRGERR